MRLSGVLWNTEEALVRRGDTVHHVGRTGGQFDGLNDPTCARDFDHMGL